MSVKKISGFTEGGPTPDEQKKFLDLIKKLETQIATGELDQNNQNSGAPTQQEKENLQNLINQKLDELQKKESAQVKKTDPKKKETPNDVKKAKREAKKEITKAKNEAKKEIQKSITEQKKQAKTEIILVKNEAEKAYKKTKSELQKEIKKFQEIQAQSSIDELDQLREEIKLLQEEMDRKFLHVEAQQRKDYLKSKPQRAKILKPSDQIVLLDALTNTSKIIDIENLSKIIAKLSIGGAGHNIADSQFVTNVNYFKNKKGITSLGENNSDIMDLLRNIIRDEIQSHNLTKESTNENIDAIDQVTDGIHEVNKELKKGNAERKESIGILDKIENNPFAKLLSIIENGALLAVAGGIALNNDKINGAMKYFIDTIENDLSSYAPGNDKPNTTTNQSIQTTTSVPKPTLKSNIQPTPSPATIKGMPISDVMHNAGIKTLKSVDYNTNTISGLNAKGKLVTSNISDIGKLHAIKAKPSIQETPKPSATKYDPTKDTSGLLTVAQAEQNGQGVIDNEYGNIPNKLLQKQIRENAAEAIKNGQKPIINPIPQVNDKQNSASTVYNASKTNEIIKRKNSIPIINVIPSVKPELKSTIHNIVPGHKMINPIDPGNVEPPDSRELYHELFGI